MDNMQCKLVILYMLDAADGPLSTSQISEFLLRREETDYFSFQEMLDGMQQSGLISAEASYQRTLFSLTAEGQNALRYYQTRIPVSLEEEILTYLEENEIEIRELLTVYSDYYKATDGNYVAVCQIRDQDTKVVDLNLSLPTKMQAEAVCAQWRERYADIYDLLMDNLVQ